MVFASYGRYRWMKSADQVVSIDIISFLPLYACGGTMSSSDLHDAIAYYSMSLCRQLCNDGCAQFSSRRIQR